MMAHLQETPGFSTKCSGVRILVLDEADRLLDMGFKRWATLPYLTLPSHTLLCPNLPYPILFYPTLTYPILPYPTLI